MNKSKKEFNINKKFSKLHNEENLPEESLEHNNNESKEDDINNNENNNEDQKNNEEHDVEQQINELSNEENDDDLNKNKELINADEDNENNNENKDNKKNDIDNNDKNNTDTNNNSNLNSTEKLDDSNSLDNNNNRFSSLKSDENKKNNEDNIEDNEQNNNNFKFDFENNEFYNPNNNSEGNDTNNKLNIKGIINNKDKDNDNNDSGFRESNNVGFDNNDYENDFEFENNDDNFNNKNSIKNEENKENKNNNNDIENNPYQENMNNLRNKPNYINNNENKSNINNNNILNNNQRIYKSNNSNISNGSENNKQNTTNTNQTTTNFIAQESPIINSLNYTTSPEIPKKHPDYDPYYEKFEEFREDTDGESIDPNKMGKDSSKTTGAQIANTIMGAGILSIPIIMRYLGFFLGSILIIFLALSTIYSVYILIRCHEITGKNGYCMLGKITMGKFGSMLIKIIIIINNLGLCIAYFRIFGEVSQTIIQGWVSPESFWAKNWHNFIYILFCSVIMIFFIFIKNVSSLKKVSYLGVLAVLIFTISLIILLFYKIFSNYLDSEVEWTFLLPNCTFSEAFRAIPTVFLAFLFQFNVFPIYHSLKHRNMETMMKATKIGVGYSLINFLIVGIVGFTLYGLRMNDTILNNFSEDMTIYKDTSTFIKVQIIIISISFVTSCLTSFPILFLSLRENSVNSLIFCLKNCCRKQSDDEKLKMNKKEKKYKYISDRALVVLTFSLYYLIILLSIVMPKLKFIFSVVGSTAGTFIAFILPNLFYIRICKISGKNYNIILPLFFLILGFFFLIVSIFVTFF